MKKIEFKIDGMTCNGCVKSIEGAIKMLDGVNIVNINLDTKTAKVEFDEDKLSEEDIFKAVKVMGYKIVK